MIEVQKSSNKQRCIVAKEEILQNTLIEVSPIATIPSEQLSIIDKTEIFRYYFVQSSEYSERKICRGYIVFGLTSLCNHSENPNSKVCWIENEVGLWCHLVAIKNIEPGEEVTLFYTNIDKYVDIDRVS